MMYPIMVKIDFAEVIKAGKSIKPVGLTLIINWAVKPFTMYGISLLFLGVLFHGLIGPEATDVVKLPLGAAAQVGQQYGAGTVIMSEGVMMLEVPLWRSYLAGCILLGIAPCTAMVLVWGSLARGNDGHTLVSFKPSFQWRNPRPEVAIESVDMKYDAQAGSRWGTPALLAITAATEVE